MKKSYFIYFLINQVYLCTYPWFTSQQDEVGFQAYGF